MPHVQFVRHPEILPYTPVNVAQHKMLLLFGTVKVIVAKIELCNFKMDHNSLQLQ